MKRLSTATLINLFRGVFCRAYGSMYHNRSLAGRLGTCIWLLVILLGVSHHSAKSQGYRAGDRGQAPRANSTTILPEKFVRGYDPVTVYFRSNVGPGPGTADNGQKLLRIEPSWPGAYFWLDKRTLQFRPAEPWPALARYAVSAKGAKAILTTMMSAPQSLSPAAGSDRLKPFRTLTLTFPQALSEPALKKMIRLEIRDQPGLKDSPRQAIKNFSLRQLPRSSHQKPAVYAITLDQPVPEGKQLLINISLALGQEGKVLWTGRLTTRLPFHLQQVTCGSSSFSLVGKTHVPKERALACGARGEKPQLVFSANVQNLTLTALKKMVRLEPSVENLHFTTYGSRVSLLGKFVPDVLYRMSLHRASIYDDSERLLQDPGELEVYFYLGWKRPFIRWSQARSVLEAKGPRQVPLVGYGDKRADIRIYRIDPHHLGLWPFPNRAVTVNEEEAPPFPGEEPQRSQDDLSYVDTQQLKHHLRLLGSPLVSRIVDLPLQDKSNTTHFGLNIGPLLDQAVGRHRAGTYLVGLRRLTGPPKRHYVRVQVTNLSLTAVEEHRQVVLYVRSLDSASAVSGAKIILEAVKKPPKDSSGKRRGPPTLETKTLTTDSAGRAVLEPNPEWWRRLFRLSVHKGEDMLVLDPRDPPPRFASNHWSPSSRWLHWLTEKPPAPKNDRLLAFVFTERAIYRPGEKVFIKGFVRSKQGGDLLAPADPKKFALKVNGPSGEQWILPTTISKLAGFAAEFQEKDIATGRYRVELFEKKSQRVLATRRFQIEAYRIPTFEVQLSGKPRVRLDTPFHVKAVARYYAGGSVAEQPIEWTVTKRPYHYVPSGREGFIFASSSQFARSGRTRQPDTTRSDDTLDEMGSARMQINPALDLDGSPRIYRFEATVTGVDNQRVSAVHETKALPPFVLGLKLKRYSKDAFELKPKIIAVGVDNKLSAGQEVTVRLYRRLWHSHLRETNFATGEAKYVTEQEDRKLLEKKIKTKNHPVVPNFAIKRSGVYVVELEARDRLGRVQTLSADLYVGGQEAVSWQKPKHGVFELATDKKKYRPGETAELVIKSPFRTGHALVIVEQPEGNRYHWHRVENGGAVHSLKIARENVPNLPLHVVLMRGRLGQASGKNNDDRYRPQTLAASHDIAVEATPNQVLVQVEHPETARPGTTQKFVISLTDHTKKPLAGEVTLWLVDEAVLSLAQEETLDPLSQFIVGNKRRTSVRDTRNRVVGRLQEREEDPGGDGEERRRKRGVSQKRVVRKNFKSVPYYQATVEVGRSGRLTLPIKLSDDLTNFQVRAVAVSGMQRFGLHRSRLRVRLPVLVQPQLPRFVRQGDQFWLGGIARLVEGDEGPARVDFQISGPIDASSGSKKVELTTGKAVSSLFKASARSSGTGEAQKFKVRLDVTRLSDGVGDAFEISIPVLPDRRVQHFAYFDSLQKGAGKLRAFPETPREGTATQKITLSSAPGMLQAVAGVDYLAAYPHGCLEQKMSQLVAEIEVGKALEQLGLSAHYSKRVKKHVLRLLDELAVYQEESGLFSYWPGGRGDIALTAQALEFLLAAQTLGAKPGDKVEKRAIKALKQVLRSDYGRLDSAYQYNQRASAIRALGTAGHVDEHYLVDLFHERAAMDLSSLANLSSAMLYKATLFEKNLEQMRQDLWQSVVFKLHKQKRVVTGLRWRRSDWGATYLGSNTATLAAVFDSLLRLDPKDQRHQALLEALLARSNASTGFGSTADNRLALRALMTYLQRVDYDNKKASLRLLGHGELRLDSSHRVASTSVRSTTPLQVELAGAEPIDALVHYSYLPKAPGDKAPALKQGFIVQRSASHIYADGKTTSHYDEKRGQARSLALGDILELHCNLINDMERHHVALVVPFAAGLEYLNPDLATSGAQARPSSSDSIRATYVQRLDQELRYYFTTLPKGSHSFHFRVRATVEGSFVHPGPHAEQMYHQEVRGRGPGMRIEVMGTHHK